MAELWARLSGAVGLAEQAVRERDQALHERVLLARELGTVGAELAAAQDARDAARRQAAGLSEELARLRGEFEHHGAVRESAPSAAAFEPAPASVAAFGSAPPSVPVTAGPAPPDAVADEEQRAQDEARALLEQARAAIARLGSELRPPDRERAAGGPSGAQ